MQEITRVFLENEMDVILAHKRSIRLAELAGLSMSGQTTFATAVSEVSRSAMEQDNTGQLVLGIEIGSTGIEKFIVAQVRESGNRNGERYTEGIQYAQRLIRNVTLTQNEADNNIELRFRIPNAQRVTPASVKHWIEVFENDLPTSPYDEIKRKNRQLVDLAEKLRSSEQQYRVLSETLPLFIFSRDAAKGLVYFNKWAQHYTGISLAELSDARWEGIIHPDEYAGVMELWAESFLKGQPINHQMRLKEAATGEYLWHLSVMMPQQNEEGEVATWSGFCVDIHAQKLIEQTLKDNKELKVTQGQLTAKQAELEANVEQLNKSNEELERFAYIASHDLQEPLRKIIVYGDYLQKKFAPALDEQGKTFLGNMIRSTGRMQQSIRDLLEFSKLGKGQDTPEPVDLNIVATDARADLEVAIREKGAAINIDSLPTITGNRHQLQQLFFNIIGNALKYAQDNVTPQITVQAAIADGQVTLSFADNGIGFEDAYTNQIFGLFQRLHTRDKYDGTGIGLAICKRVAELHGGSITAHSELGKGSVFVIVLPLGA